LCTEVDLKMGEFLKLNHCTQKYVWMLTPYHAFNQSLENLLDLTLALTLVLIVECNLQQLEDMTQLEVCRNLSQQVFEFSFHHN
jgi:hypothetical protein